MRDTEILEAALIGFQHLRNQVEEKIAALRSQIGAAPAGRQTSSHKVAAESAPKKRTMSAAARKRIAAAQKKRWAEHRKRMAAAAKA